MVSIVLMVLIVVIAIAMSGLAAIELRKSGASSPTAMARQNARLALIQAIGQLQRTMGPDQRVTASAEILSGKPKQPHWTGVWKTNLEDGTSFFKRDDLAGGLSDARSNGKFHPEERVMEWLVSGKDDPRSGTTENPVVLANLDDEDPITVSKLGILNAKGKLAGHHAWWTGDLGARANIGTRDPRSEQIATRGGPGSEAWFRLMASQAADPSMMTGGPDLDDAEVSKLASTATLDLVTKDKSWSRKHSLDFTVSSFGVLADVAKGGLKRDLTAYFQSGGTIGPWRGIPGLADSDPLLGDAGEGKSRLAKNSPRFGLLRDWARLDIPFSGKNAASRLPETAVDASSASLSRTLALANETPVKLDGNTRSALQPILVEATNYTQMSTYQQPGGGNSRMFQMRQLMYPRVVLWNPYNVEMRTDPAIVMMQGNGRQELNTLTSSGFVVQWLNFEGGRDTSFSNDFLGILNGKAYQDPYMGSYYFSIPATTFGPGECLVFSPPKAAEYDGLSAYRKGPYNLNNNVLICEAQPDPAKCYYVSGSDINTDGFPYLLTHFWYAPVGFNVNGSGVAYQSDDTRAIMKSVGSASTVTFEDFDKLPQLAVLSASLQYGAGKEPRIAWNTYNRMPMELLDRANPKPTVIPDVRTRESVRLRWFDEHRSNVVGAGKLANTPFFEEALLANWNPRAPFAIRSPWENIGGTLPVSGATGGPWFFGAFTRDLFDQDVSWQEQMPLKKNGKCYGNPFGPPQEGTGRYVLFDVPRTETGVLSLGQLQHAKISELVWHPSYAIGNSLADPRLGTGGNKGLNRTAAVAQDSSANKLGGFHENQLGWSADTNRAKNRSEWAATARTILANLPDSDNLVYDLSFESNQALWDTYFLSSGTSSDKAAFARNPFGKPLPNARMKPARPTVDEDAVADFHRAASALLVDGAFNVNSTRVEAWKTLLASTRACGYGGEDKVPFPRVLDAPEGAWTDEASSTSEKTWAGYRELSSDEIDRLARAIVDEVKLRGPFLSLSDFVNRRLSEDETGRMGALEAAIRKAGLNSSLAAEYPLDNKTSLPDYKHPDNISDATRLEQTLKPESKAWGAPAWLTQGDLLQVLGPALSARSDSFVVRAYGDAVDAKGAVTARAWCEAVIQRMPDPIHPDDSGINSRNAGDEKDFGRRLVIASFRWLSSEEI